MSPEAQKLAQALLDHHRKMRRFQKEACPNVESRLIVYEDLCEQAGLSHLKPNVGKFLREVAQWCHENGWPPLNALAVNHQTRRPGRGYDRAPGCSRERWQDEVTACISFAGYPDSMP
ncbi:MAG TPA: hypothetical protein VJ864_13750 [Candidatus Binatia bacterium]|jgi:hypothetical protein|nr:hypothetical protein [Candidatus Binatia bacterium]